MNKINQKHPLSDDDQWLVFQYVHGELSPNDVEAFEQRLLEDLPLCDAVAEASLLTLAIAAAETSIPPVQRHVPSDRGLYRIAAVVTSLCCCVGLLLVLSQPAQFQFRSTTIGTSTPFIDADLLMTVWADNGESVEALEELDFVVSTDDDLTIPDWMLAGLSESGADTTMESATPPLMNDNPELL